jgi:hypothetical protein
MVPSLAPLTGQWKCICNGTIRAMRHPNDWRTPDPPVRPALPLYEALLRSANRQLSKTGPIPEPEALLLSSWLGSATLQADAVDLLTSGARLAQEAVGYERLRILPSWI